MSYVIMCIENSDVVFKYMWKKEDGDRYLKE